MMASSIKLLSFTVKQVARDPQPAGNYNYEIYQGTVLIARYWHDYRGDDQRIIFLNKKPINPPFGSSSDFLTGGGPGPLGLSSEAIEYIASKIEGK